MVIRCSSLDSILVVIDILFVGEDLIDLSKNKNQCSLSVNIFIKKKHSLRYTKEQIELIGNSAFILSELASL